MRRSAPVESIYDRVAGAPAQAASARAPRHSSRAFRLSSIASGSSAPKSSWACGAGAAPASFATAAATTAANAAEPIATAAPRQLI